MSKIGFIGCHEISWHCLKKVCELSKKYQDEVNIVFNLDFESSKKHSAYVNFDSLKDISNFDLYYVSDVAISKNIELLKNAKLDILFIIGWHKIVPKEILDQAKISLGIHSSLLPKDRGSSPINWEIIRGEKTGGVTLFHLTEGVDEGDIVDSQAFEISENHTVKDVYYSASVASLELLEKNWQEIHNLTPKRIPQDESLATLNPRRKPSDGLLNWNQEAIHCYNFVRALTHPYPGAFTFYNGRKVYIWKSKVCSKKAIKPGQVVSCDSSIVVSTNNGCLELLSLQIENEPVCSSELFTKTYDVTVNDFFISK